MQIDILQLLHNPFVTVTAIITSVFWIVVYLLRSIVSVKYLDTSVNRLDAKIDKVSGDIRTNINMLDTKIDRLDTKIDKVAGDFRSDVRELRADIKDDIRALQNTLKPIMQPR